MGDREDAALVIDTRVAAGIAEKATPPVMHCNAGECGKRYKASVVAIKAGYSKVHWFRGGMPEWAARRRSTQ